MIRRNDPEGMPAREEAGGQLGDEKRGDGLARGGADRAHDGVVAGVVVGGEHGGDGGVDQGEGDEDGSDGEPEAARGPGPRCRRQEIGSGS